MFKLWRSVALKLSGLGSFSHHKAKRVLFFALAGVALVLVVVVIFQFSYPNSRSLPYATVNGKSVGDKTIDEIIPILQSEFEASVVKLRAGNVSSEASLASLGADLDESKTAESLMKYEWWQKLIPFSVFWLKPNVSSIEVKFDETSLTEKTKELASKMTSLPKNGTVAIDAQGKVNLSSAEDGVSVTTEEAVKAVKAARYVFGANTVAVTPATTKPAVTNEMLTAVKDKIDSVLAVSFTLKNSMDDKASTTSDKATVASWIKIGDDLSLSLDKDKVSAYANQFAKAQVVAAGTTKVTLVDGVETGRVVGASGRGVAVDALVADLSKVLLEKTSSTATVQFTTIAPNVTYSRSYSSSQAGLQAYVSDVTSGGNIEIAVRQLSGSGWSASGGASKSVVSASTYKLFVSSLLFDKINAGQINWSDPIQGTNVDGCLTNTIVVSANNCAEQWLGEWGRSNMNSALYAKGFSSATTFTAADATHTSAADLQKLLIGLQNQTMFNASDSGKLLALMKRQVYRQGIPSGSGGSVADKVGFLWDYLNDAAIVYHPRGTYVLVVMTKGQTWGKIAEITRQIEAIMYP